MKRALLAVLLLTAGLAGCIGDDDPSEPAASTNSTNASTATPPDDPVVALTGCEEGKPTCYEPNAAWTSDGTLLVTEVDGRELARSVNNGSSFEVIDPPPLPDGVPDRGDALLQTGPNGSLWVSALTKPVPSIPQTAIEVARSDDGGRTWAMHQVLSMSLLGEPTGATEAGDRQWLAFGPEDRVYLVCQCPNPTTQMRTSTDGGETWSSPTQIPTLPRPGPAGKPAVTPNGTIVVPYLTGPPSSASQLVGVGVSVSHDGRDSWMSKQIWVDPGPSAASCCNFPNAAATSDGAVHVGWRTTSSNQALVASSTDGGSTWNNPADWSKQSADPAGPSGLWLEPLNGSRLAATWFDRADDGTLNAVAATGTADGAQAHYNIGETRPVCDGQTACTDHPYAALGPGGLLAVPFVDTDGNVSVNVLEDPTGEGR